MKYTIEQHKWTGRNIYGPAVMDDENTVVAGPYTPLSTVRVDVIDPKRIELIVTDSNAGMVGEKIVLLS